MPDPLYGSAAGALVSWAFSAAFGIAGVVHLAVPRFLKRAYNEPRRPRHFYRGSGLWMLMAGGMLAVSPTRLAGTILGGFLVFSTTVLMLERRRYVALVLAVPLLAVLLFLGIVDVYGT